MIDDSDSSSPKVPGIFVVRDSSMEMSAKDIDLSKLRQKLNAGVVHAPRGKCTLGVGCDESGACFAAAQGEPDLCGRETQVVLCDGCGEDYTDRPDNGGILFVSKALCPTCGVRWEEASEREHETAYIRARCPEGKSFADWVREDLRRPRR